MTIRRCFGLMLIGCFVGCGGGTDGPDTLDVSGTITMDGKPLPNAGVTFRPADITAGLRMAAARTDENGYYELDFSSSQSGAQPGEYIVTISTAVEDTEGKNSPETVPDTYNSKSDLKANVTEDKTTFDFKLDSSNGEVIQPDTDSTEE